MNATTPYRPVLEIGGTHVTAALADLDHGTVVAGSVRRDRLEAAGTADQITTEILKCGSSLPVQPGARWGVAIPGPFDYSRGIALFTGVGKFDSLYGMDMRSTLSGGLPAQPGSVAFLNDADAFLLGEWLFGAAAGHDRCIGITLGTGIGSAFLADGTLRTHGSDVPPQARIDLLEIAGRPLEDFVSRRAIRSAYASRTNVTHHSGRPATPDVAEIAARARAGDHIARSVLTAAFETLGTVLAPWLAAFRATVLVVGGSMTGSWDLLEPALRAGLTRPQEGTPARVDVRTAAQPDHAALLGAAWHARATAAE